MYIKECKWCKKEIRVEKQCLFALHVANCDSNPGKLLRNNKSSEMFKGKEKVERILLKQNCPKCNKEFEIKITKSQLKTNKYKKFCSRQCANSKNWSEEHKKKLSEINKKSDKVKNANKLIGLRLKKGNKEKEFICEHCGEIGYSNRYGKKKQRFHKECWLKISGGIREGSSRGRCGWYKGYWCDSSYELAY